LQTLELFIPPAVHAAVNRGTRSLSGAPGPDYWQNSSDYQIRARVTPADSTLHGEETVTYHNASPDTLRYVLFHLYQNLMAPLAAREAPASWSTGGMILEEIRQGGQAVPLPVAAGRRTRDVKAARVFGTSMRVPLPEPLLPGEMRTFFLRWHFRIPPVASERMGIVDETTAQIAQWYPQIAVYDDVHGWDAQQYMGTGEFYLDYGHFHYSVTLPAGFIVGGTGTLTNPEEVLTEAEIQVRARAADSDEIVHVLTAEGFGPGSATRGSEGDLLTWEFDAEHVRDVAFSYSDHYLWDATRALVDAERGRRAMVYVMYRPQAPGFPQVAAMARAALESHSRRLVPYPYPQLTQTEGGSGGMEYPMTVFVQAYRDVYRMDEVTAHEIGHEWFPMLVGSNETRYGWQDEGLNTFDTFFATDDYFGEGPGQTAAFVGKGLRDAQKGYVGFARRADEDLTMMSPANSFGVVDAGYVVEAYDKPASTLWALRSMLGAEKFERAYHAYIERWAYRHPTPWDFFLTFDDVTGVDLAPVWGPWFFGRERLDQAVAAVEQSDGRLRVTVENRGGLYAPVDVTATLADGTRVLWRQPMAAWYAGSRRIVVSHPVAGRVTRVELDAAGDFPDVDRDNNVWAAP